MRGAFGAGAGLCTAPNISQSLPLIPSLQREGVGKGCSVRFSPSPGLATRAAEAATAQRLRIHNPVDETTILEETS